IVVIVQSLHMNFFYTGVSDGSDVIQTHVMLKYQGENATMECRHVKGVGYFQMFWYRKLPGEPMKQIVYNVANNKPYFEPDFANERFSIIKQDHLSGRFTVKNYIYTAKWQLIRRTCIKAHRDTKNNIGCTQMDNQTNNMQEIHNNNVFNLIYKILHGDHWCLPNFNGYSKFSRWRKYIFFKF
uniref:Immunoglobulin V-set domain-containing protein n=1 Tax=Kryptolebias marmoratus TaxID=37003 RepID=A0A3Q3B056_KRYMA